MASESDQPHDENPPHDPAAEHADEPRGDAPPGPNSPQFHDAPRGDQPGMAPPAGAPGRPTPNRAGGPPPPPPAPAKGGGASSLISNVLMMLVGAGLLGGGAYLYHVFAPPKPPGEVSTDQDKDMVKKEDFQKVSDRVNQLATDMDQAKKQIADRPDYSPQIKLLGDRINEVSQTVTNMPAQFDSINQKLETMGRVEGTGSGARVESLDKRVDELSKALDALRMTVATAPRGPAPAAASRPEDINVEGAAMEQAVDLYNAKKFTEARAAFVKLQSAFPNDARVWYYSALANGFATGQWLGDTERMVNMGLDKEKAGQPDSARIDAVFANLTPATGKDWLASYRKRISK